MKLYIISNRLPVKAVHRDGAYLFTRSEGGLATGLHALHTRYEKHWIGWPGVDVETDEDRRSIREELAKMNFHPIFLTPEQIANYYEGYSNSTIWPLCHYFFAFTRYRKDFWEAYRDGYAAGWFTRYEIIESPLYAENIEEKGGAADDAAKTDLL